MTVNGLPLSAIPGSGFVTGVGSWLSTLPRIASLTGLTGPSFWGGQWVRGTSWHPQRCIATFEKVPGAEGHPVWQGLDVVTAYDERYSDLDVHEDSVPLIHHELSEQWQVMGWAHGSNVVYDAMGHDRRSYMSETRRRYLLNEVEWLLG